jgi:hypothetical protein
VPDLGLLPDLSRRSRAGINWWRRRNRVERVLVLVADLDVRVLDQDGAMICHLELDPSVNYQGRSRVIV